MITSALKTRLLVLCATVLAAHALPVTAGKPGNPGGGGSGPSCSLLGSTSADPISVVREVYSYKRSGAAVYKRQDFYLQSGDGTCAVIVASTTSSVANTGRLSFHFDPGAGRARLAWGERVSGSPTVRFVELATNENGQVTTALPAVAVTLVNSTSFGGNAPHVAFSRGGSQLAFVLNDVSVAEGRVMRIADVEACAAAPAACVPGLVGKLEGGLLGADLSWNPNGSRIYSAGRCEAWASSCTLLPTTGWAIFYWETGSSPATIVPVISDDAQDFAGGDELDVGPGELLAVSGGAIYDVEACVSAPGACRVRDNEGAANNAPWYPKWAENCASGATSCLYYSAGTFSSPDLIEYPTDTGAPDTWTCHETSGSCVAVATGQYFDAAY